MNNNENYNVLIDEVVVTAKGEGAKSATSEKCSIIDCLKIYPFRFGIYDQGREQELSFISNGSAEMQKLLDIKAYPRIQDQWNKYAYYPMTLRSGYVYVKSEQDNGVYEYESVDGLNFVMLEFYGSKKAKPRIKAGTRSTALLVSAFDTVGLLYSPVRLVESFVRLQLLRKDSDHMQWLNCEDWSNDGGPEQSDLSQRRLDTNDAYVLYPNQGDFHDAGHTNVLSLNLSEARSQNPETKEKQRDLCFVLDDAWGIAEQVRSDLLDVHLEHDALMRSLRTGVNPDYIKQQLYKQAEFDDDFSDAGLLMEYCANGKTSQNDLEQAGIIHELGTILYKYFNENTDAGWQEYIGKGKKTTDLPRLKKMLAIEERRAIRQKIEDTRYALELVLISDVYQDFCALFSKAEAPDFYGEDKTGKEKSDILSAFFQMILEAKEMVAEAYRDLSKVPHRRDQHIDLAIENNNYQDQRKSAFIPVIEGKNGAGKLLHLPFSVGDYVNDLSSAIIDRKTNQPLILNTEGLTERDISPKLAKYITVINTIVDGMQKIAYEERLLKVFSGAVQHGNVTKILLIVEEADVRRVLKEKHWLVNYRNNENHIQKLSGNQWAIKAKSQKDFDKGIVRLNVVKAKPSKGDVIARLLRTSLVYQGVMDGFFLASFGSLLKENDELRVGINSLSFIGGAVAMQRRYMAASIRATSGINQKVRKETLRKLGLQTRVFGYFGGYSDAIGDGYSAVLSSRDKDYDAMACNILSSSATASAMTIGIVYGKAVWAGWAGLALAVIAVGSKVLYEYLKDTPLESFVKHSVYCKDLQIQRMDLSPYEIVQLLCQSVLRTKLAHKRVLLIDYQYQLEEFIYCQAMMPLFTADAIFGMTPVISESGTRDVVASFHLRIKSSLAHLTLNLESVEMEVYYVPYVSSTWLMDFDKQSVKLAATEETKAFGYLNKNQEADNQLAYNFDIYNEDLFNDRKTRFFEREEAYVVLKIRFFHKKEHVTPLNDSNNDNRFLFYLYKVSVAKKSHRGRNTTYLDFDEVTLSREKVLINTFEYLKKEIL